MDCEDSGVLRKGKSSLLCPDSVGSKREGRSSPSAGSLGGTIRNKPMKEN